MGTWRVPADVLASSRFAISPMAEVVGALGALTRPRSPDQRSFREAHGAAFADWLASDRPRPTWWQPASATLGRAGRLDGRLPEHAAREARTRRSTTGLDLLRRLSDEDLSADLRETTQRR